MASVFPGGLDSFNTAHVTGEVIQAATDNDEADAINKIEAELGTNPSSGYTTVGARFAAIEEAPINLTHPTYGAFAGGDIAAPLATARAAHPRGRFMLPYGTYLLSSMLDFDDAQSITLEGLAGNAATQATRINFTGTGTNPALRIRHADGFTLRNIKLVAMDNAFTGDMIDCGMLLSQPTTNLTIDSCWIGGDSTSADSAASLVNLAGTVGARIMACSFFNAILGIIGQSTTEPANTISIGQGTIFNNLITGAIKDPGEAWDVSNCSFERLQSGAAGAFVSSHDTNRKARGFKLATSWFGDITTNSGTWVDIHGKGIQIEANCFDSRTMTNVININAYSCEGLVVMANEFRHGANGVKLDTGGTGVAIIGNDFDTVTAPYTNDNTAGRIVALGNQGVAELIEMGESGDFAAPVGNRMRYYSKDNGSGKTQFAVRFNTGAVQTPATEP